MTVSQLALDISAPQEDFSQDNFIVSEANQEAYQWIKQWPEWPSHCLVVYGSEGCGKTHLAHIWQEVAGAQFVELGKAAKSRNVIVENIETITDEEALFHLYNDVQSRQGFLLLTSHKAPAQLEIELPDLKSRLLAAPLVSIYPPDDYLLKSVLMKQFADRQLRVNKEVLHFIVPRIDRSFTVVQELVNALDSFAIKQKRNITVPLVREYLTSS